jgi:hypothetical protein
MPVRSTFVLFAPFTRVPPTYIEPMELAVGAVLVLMLVYLFVYSRWRKWEIARERKRKPRKAAAGGLIAPFDEVFHPTAYTASLIWEAEQSIPAPAPNADGGRLDLASGRITIDLNDRDGRSSHGLAT